MNTSDFTIVIPTYNRSELVLRLINSLETQTLRPSEVLLVDDLSEDSEHRELLRIASESTLKVTVVRAPIKMYAEGARRLGAQLCKSEQTIFIDSDNVLPSSFCAEMLQVFARYPSALLGCRTYFLNAPDRIWFESVGFSLWTALATYRNGADSVKVDQVETHHCPNIFMCLRSTYLAATNQEFKYGIPMEEAALAIRACRIMRLPCRTNLRTFAFHDVEIPQVGNFNWSGQLARQRMLNLLRNKRRIVREFGSWPQRVFYSVFFRLVTLVLYVVYNFRALTPERIGAMLVGTFGPLD